MASAKREKRNPGLSHLGRPKGSKDKAPGSPARAAAIAANAAQPRIGFLSDEVRKELEASKGMLAKALSKRGTQWLLQIIDEGPSRWAKMSDGTRVLVDGSIHFEWAMNFAADRAGMPRRSETDLMGISGFTITIAGVEGGLGWPAAGSDAQHDEPGTVAH